MNGCSKRIGSPEPRWIGARSLFMLPDTKGDTGGTASRSPRVGRYVSSVIVSTINVNGIRAAVKQRSPENLGLLPWLEETTADVVCLQETRADDEQLAEALAPALADGWHLASADPHLKGRNGVAVLSRHPINPRRRSGPTATSSPRTDAISRSTPDGLTVASVYFQTGEAGTDRQLEKERFMVGRWSRADGDADRTATPWCAATGTSRTPRTTSRTGRAT